MGKTKIYISKEHFQENVNKLIEIAKKIDWSDSFEALKKTNEAIEIFREDEEEFKPVYQKRHWKRAKGAVGIWKR